MQSLSLHNLKPAKGAKRTVKRVGRGNASGKGTTAARGSKGQKARTGGRNRLKLIGLKRLVMSTPKLRGFRSLRAKADTVTLDALNAGFQSGAVVSPETLRKKGLAASSKVKILGTGKLAKKLTIKGCALTEGAKEKIVAAGGEIR